MLSNPLALRPREAANSIGVSERTLRTLVAVGAIQPAKVGRCTLFPVDELRRFLAASTAKPGPDAGKGVQLDCK